MQSFFTTIANWISSTNAKQRKNEIRQERGLINFCEGLEPRTLLSSAPRVTNLVVAGSSWSSNFVSYLNTLSAANVNGYSIPTGSSQLTTLPWNNINQISITFDQAVNVQQSDLQVSGINAPSYAFSAFSYNATTDTATWTLSQTIGDDRVQLDLNDLVSNSTSQNLSGTWIDGISRYPSGLATISSPLIFGFNVLPGDVNHSNGVNVTDLVITQNGVGTTPGVSGYSIFSDINGSGGINVTDLVSVQNMVGQTLPPGLTTPTNLQATAVSSNEIDLTWTDGTSDETGFNIYRSDDGTDGWTLVGTAAAGATSFADTSVEDGSTYYYCISAFSANADSVQPTLTSASTPIGQPGSVTVTQLPGGNTAVSWPDNSQHEPGYILTVTDNSNNPPTNTQINLPPNDSDTDSDTLYDLKPGDSYSFSVKLATQPNTSPDPAFATVNGGFPAGPPRAPTELSATPIDPNLIDLVWRDNSSAELGFQIERSLDNGKTWVQFAVVSANVVSYTAVANAPQTTVGYRIRAYDAGGESSYSNKSFATTPPAPAPPAVFQDAPPPTPPTPPSPPSPVIAPSSTSDGWTVYGDSVTASGNMVSIGTAGLGETDTQTVGVHGASILIPANGPDQITVQYNLNSWDSYNADGLFDIFSANITQQPYNQLNFNHKQIESTRYSMVWGGQGYNDGQLDTKTGTTTIDVPQDGNAHYLNLVLDTQIGHNTDTLYSSWGTFTVSAVGVKLGDGSANQIVQASDDGTQNLIPLHLYVPSFMPTGTQVTLSTTDADKVDVWDNDDPTSDDTPLLGGSSQTSQISWTVGSGTIPDTLYVGGTDASAAVGDLVFTLAAATSGPSTTPDTSKGTIAGIQIEILNAPNGENPIENWNGKTDNWLVGQMVDLKAVVDPAGLNNLSYQWTVPGNTLYAWNANLNQAAATPLKADNNGTGTGDQEIKFFWVSTANSPESDKVQLTIKDASGKSYNAFVTFNVFEPTAQIQATQGQIGTYANSQLFAYGPNAPGQMGGMNLSTTVTLPAQFNGENGFWNYVQTATFNRTVIDTQGNKLVSPANGKTGLDTTFPYGLNNMTKYATTAPDGTAANPTGNQAGATWDAPQSTIDPTVIKSVTDADSFDTYVMFRPSGNNSQWVLLDDVQWSWSGTASWNGAWQILNPLAPAPKIVNVSDEPSWTLNAGALLSQPLQ